MPAAQTRSLNSALAWAKAQVGDYGWRRLCLSFVRQAWGLGTSGIATAGDGWSLTERRHTDRTPPPGAPVWFNGPTSADHVALSAGNGYVYSNDILSPGRIDKVKIATILDRWNCDYRGWTEDYPVRGAANVRLPLDLVGEKPSGGELKVGQRVVVSTPAGLKARLKPGTGAGTDSGRTVAKGYRIKITQISHAGNYLWIKADRYWYAAESDRGDRYVKKV